MKKANKIKLWSILGLSIFIPSVVIPTTLTNTLKQESVLLTNNKKLSTNSISTPNIIKRKSIQSTINIDSKLNDNYASVQLSSPFGKTDYADLLTYSEIDVNSLINDLLIGNMNEYDYMKDIGFNIVKSNDSFSVDAYFDNTKTTINYGFFKHFSCPPDNDFNNWPISYSFEGANFKLNDIWDKDIQGTYSDVTLKDYGSSGNYDFNRISTTINTTYNSITQKLIFKNNVKLESYNIGMMYTSELISIRHNTSPEGLQMDLDIVMPYSLNDIESFKSLFKQIMAEPIKIEGDINSILFDSKQINTNEQTVMTIFNDRLNNFLNTNPSLLNKLGSVVTLNNSNNKWELNKNNVDIILDIPTKVKDKTGPQTCFVKFKLKNNQQFDFNENGLQNEYSVPIQISLIAKPVVTPLPTPDLTPSTPIPPVDNNTIDQNTKPKDDDFTTNLIIILCTVIPTLLAAIIITTVILMKKKKNKK